MFENIKRFFCKHNYINIAYTKSAEDADLIMFYVCQKCGKRKVFMNSYTKFRTADWYKDLVDNWLKDMYDLREEDVTSPLITPEKMHLENCWKVN